MTNTTRRLGRLPSSPDGRDWTVSKLHARVAPAEGLLDLTVREAIATSAFFRTWAGILALWRWIKTHLNPTPAPPAPADAPAWRDLVVLDQGDYGTCVGNGCAGWMAAAPVEDPFVDERLARKIYYEATVLDGQPDDPDAPGGGQQGASVRSGIKALKNRGRLAAYAFAATIDEVREWLDHHGPVVFGTDWYTGMFSPDAGGFVNLTGVVEGGHCYLCVDYDPSTDSFLFVNSWGIGWGLRGRFWVRARDVAALLANGGEACCAVELAA